MPASAGPSRRDKPTGAAAALSEAVRRLPSHGSSRPSRRRPSPLLPPRLLRPLLPWWPDPDPITATPNPVAATPNPAAVCVQAPGSIRGWLRGGRIRRWRPQPGSKVRAIMTTNMAIFLEMVGLPIDMVISVVSPNPHPLISLPVATDWAYLLHRKVILRWHATLFMHIKILKHWSLV